MNMQVLDARCDMSGGYKVNVSRGEWIGRVSSEWFSRLDDEQATSPFGLKPNDIAAGIRRLARQVTRSAH
jgi:hypothetical protein